MSERPSETDTNALVPSLSSPPLDCTNACMDGLCDCSGEFRVVAYTKKSVDAALDALVADRDALGQRVDHEVARAEGLREQRDEAEAERDRLAAALAEVLGSPNHEYALIVAREALAGVVSPPQETKQ